MKEINVLKLIIIVLTICLLVLCGYIVYNNLNEEDSTSKEINNTSIESNEIKLTLK